MARDALTVRADDRIKIRRYPILESPFGEQFPFNLHPHPILQWRDLHFRC